MFGVPVPKRTKLSLTGFLEWLGGGGGGELVTSRRFIYAAK
jgi:hypothetical protein